VSRGGLEKSRGKTGNPLSGSMPPRSLTAWNSTAKALQQGAPQDFKVFQRPRGFITEHKVLNGPVRSPSMVAGP